MCKSHPCSDRNRNFSIMRPDYICSKFGPDCAMRHVLCSHRVHLINRNRKFSFDTTDPSEYLKLRLRSIAIGGGAINRNWRRINASENMSGGPEREFVKYYQVYSLIIVEVAVAC